MGTIAATYRKIDGDDDEGLDIEAPKALARERRRLGNARNQRRRRVAYVTVALTLASRLTITRTIQKYMRGVRSRGGDGQSTGAEAPAQRT